MPEDIMPSAPSPADDASGGESATDARPLLVEVAWEVCQQWGGIYTVLRSKAPAMLKRWGSRYLLLGPYNPNTSPTEFEESPPPAHIAPVVKQMRNAGYDVRYGTWLVTGRPPAVLLNPRSAFNRLADIKYGLWERHQISLPGGDGLVDEVAAFGFLAQEFFRLLTGPKMPSRPVIAHFHEWMVGTVIPEIRRTGLPVAVVFTTHATQVGRYMAANEGDFYDKLPWVDWLGAAQRYNLEAKARIERAAAHGAHVFTTLSEITAYECEYLLGRKPDLLVPNGLNIERFVAMHEFQNLHRRYKEQIHQFVMAHFFPAYTFDLDRTLYLFTAGRYEYRNKGYDLVVEAMARLNARLKRDRQDRTVVLFVITQRPCRSMNAEVLRSRAVMEEIRRNCEQIKDQFGERLFAATAMGEWPKFESLVDDFWLLRLRRMLHAWRTHRLPMIVTHDLLDEHGDDLLRKIHACMLFNLQDDPVKIVYHPDFVTSTNPLFGMDYDQFVRGCHMGVFPSWYEPWGYTPQECVALGLPAVTSDVAGFGTYLLEQAPDHRERGLFVLRRRGRSDHEAADDLADFLMEFLTLDRRERIAQRNRIEDLASQFDWQNLGRYYAQAHDLALERAGL
jgi:glycogen(starch) synthase